MGIARSCADHTVVTVVGGFDGERFGGIGRLCPVVSGVSPACGRTRPLEVGI
ncbi:MAG: hypothetical protein OXU61_02260 [Gammaproteobacteria bacterium]|nr:hypothetical protein [Gammaproteobacteria bacterium]